MKKIVTVTTSKTLMLTATQAAVVLALKRGNYTTAKRLVESIADLTDDQSDTLVRNVTSEYAKYYVYDEPSENKEITQAEYDFIHFLLTRPDRQQLVASVKFLRAQYGWSLKEANDVVDAITTTSL